MKAKMMTRRHATRTTPTFKFSFYYDDQVVFFLRFPVKESIGFLICQDSKPLAPLPPMEAELEKQVDSLCETLLTEPGSTNEDLMKVHATHD